MFFVHSVKTSEPQRDPPQSYSVRHLQTFSKYELVCNYHLKIEKVLSVTVVAQDEEDLVFMLKKLKEECSKLISIKMNI